MKRKKQVLKICLSFLFLARTLLAQSTIMSIIDNDDDCPTEGTAFDSNYQDLSAGELYSFFWVGAKTKSIKNT